MAKALETINTVNNFLRTLLAAVVVGAMTFVGWLGYNSYYATELREKRLANTEAELSEARARLDESKVEIARRDELLQRRAAEIDQLNVEIKEKDEKIERLDTAMRLLKVDTRVADVTVVEQGTDPETNEQFTRLEFQEVNREGSPVGQPKRFRIDGDMVYVDHWVVKFDDKYVEESDLDRSTSIVLFRRIFGENQKPIEGEALDDIGTAPTAYTRGGRPSEFEQRIWNDFWNIANNPDQAAELGIRAIHGDAVSMKLRPERKYRLELRASGGISIKPIVVPPANETATSL